MSSIFKLTQETPFSEVTISYREEDDNLSEFDYFGGPVSEFFDSLKGVNTRKDLDRVIELLNEDFADERWVDVFNKFTVARVMLTYNNEFVTWSFDLHRSRGVTHEKGIEANIYHSSELHVRKTEVGELINILLKVKNEDPVFEFNATLTEKTYYTETIGTLKRKKEDVTIYKGEISDILSEVTNVENSRVRS